MLIIVESPAKAKTISKIVGNKYQVKASVGHIRQISNDKKTTDGRKLEINGIDIDKGFSPIYEVDPDKSTVVSELKKLAKAATDGILFATDSDREGEAISWHLAEVLGIKDKSKVQRLEFHEITQKAIAEALAHPRPLNVELVTAQQARQVLDKLVGYKLSPVLWATIGNYKLSAGRVQSPALHLIATREREILSFKPEEYWQITGDFQDKLIKPPVQESWLLAEKDKEDSKEAETQSNILKLSKIKNKALPETIGSKAELEDLLNGLVNFSEYKISKITQKTHKNSPRPPFITSTLQQAASSRLGYSPKQTMQLAQKLYEGIDIDGQPTALITYMRTDSLNLSAESIEAARGFIKKQYPKYLTAQSRLYKSKSRNAQEAHEAIRPVNPALVPQDVKNKLEPRLWKLYDLVWRQMVSSQMTDEIRETLTYNLQNERLDEFTGSVSWTVEPGFKALTGEETSSKPANLNYVEGEKQYLKNLLYTQKFTKPPARYSAASLIKKMEELGIGRPSTYASIISTLQDRLYVENQQNVLHPLALGLKIDDLLSENFTEVTSSDMTAKMEENLDGISRGEKGYEEVLNDFWQNFKAEVESKVGQITQKRSQYTSMDTDVKCPVDGSGMELKLGRFGDYYQCSEHKEHQFPKNFREYEVALKEAQAKYADQVKGKKCEVCAKDLIVRVSKSTLNPYIACPEYQVGNKHTVLSVSFGPCPKCIKEGRTEGKQGVLVKKKGFRGKSFVGCSLPKDICGYVESEKKVEE